MKHIISTTIALFLILFSANLFAAEHSFDSQMNSILISYLKIHDSLQADSLKGVVANAIKIEAEAKMLDLSKVSGMHKDHYAKIPKNLAKYAKKIATSKEIETSRKYFKKLSRSMAMWASMSKPNGIYVMFCSMAKGSWLQDKKTLQNPYFGAKMHSCGEIVSPE